MLALLAAFQGALRNPDCWTAAPSDACALGAHATVIHQIDIEEFYRELDAIIIWFPRPYSHMGFTRPNALHTIVVALMQVVDDCIQAAAKNLHPGEFVTCMRIAMSQRTRLVAPLAPSLQVGLVGDFTLEGLSTYEGGVVARDTDEGAVVMLPTFA